MIGQALSVYDALIEINRRRIRSLEQIIRLLYEEWFVHFHFPGFERISVSCGLPKGWKRKKLSSMCTDIRESISPNILSDSTAYIGLEHIPRGSITLGDWISSAGVGSRKFVFCEGDILFGKIRPYLHKVGFALVDGITSSDTIVIRPLRSEFYEYLLLLLSSDEFVSLASRTAREGSKMPRADWNFLLQTSFLRPEGNILRLFGNAVGPVLSQLRSLALSNRRHIQARDLLLPRLMSGELSV